MVFLFALLPILGSIDAQDTAPSSLTEAPLTLRAPSSPLGSPAQHARLASPSPISLILLAVQPARRRLLQAILLGMLGTIAIPFLLMPVGSNAPPQKASRACLAT